MFTGIVEEVGTLINIKKAAKSCVLTIGADKVLEGTQIGDSIALNGVCLTVTTIGKGSYTADVMHETLSRSSLSELTAKTPVNLERAMSAEGRFGGHIVSGHIDGTGTVCGIEKDDNAIWYTIAADASILRYVVEKGSIAIDGISLTVAYVDDSCFKVSIIPHTQAETNLYTKKVGSLVNLECDIIGKYVEKLMQPAPQEEKTAGGITKEFLLEHGF
ncbi:riboflavin synthase [Eubacterium oxidoreducens]|uniref:Riboflavin synthase n=1 Tax=Eubacterium oxidoreducens TaxID=1732 RepID=A0A1G6CKK3_EUBOX|nr:riboflavin synthase [Eubacterium oxidoreducens]SDB33272.1 riboflavin synthase alpha chain [Eubacterium oxidoreducens]